MTYEKYQFRPWDPKSKKLFNKEKLEIRKVICEHARIEHVGSSAVPGLGGKGIIDIAIAVPKGKMPNSLRALERIGFERKTSSDPERRFLQKRIRQAGNERRLHIHLMYINSAPWKPLIAVRDYLIKNKDARCQYASIKKKGAKYAKGSGLRYRRFKKDFVDRLESKALREGY